MIDPNSISDPNSLIAVTFELQKINWLLQCNVISTGLTLGVLICVILLLSRSARHFW